MANLTLPNANSSFTVDPQNKEIGKIDPLWFQKLSEWLLKTNADATEIEAIKADIIAIKVFVGMPL